MRSLESQAVAARRVASVMLAVMALLPMTDLMLALDAEVSARAAITQMVYRSPVLAYLFAIGAVRGAAGRLADGGAVDAVLIRLLIGVGAALLLGAALTVAIVPMLLRALTGGGSYVAFDPAAITTGAVGLLLVLLAGPLRATWGWRRELDEIV